MTTNAKITKVNATAGDTLRFMQRLTAIGEKNPPNCAEDSIIPAQIVCIYKGKIYVK